VTRVYQAVLQGSGEHLGRALRRSFAAAYALPDDGSPCLEDATAGRTAVLRDGPSCGRYTVDAADHSTRVAALWGPAASASTAWAVVSVDAPSPEGADISRALTIISGLLDAERAFDGETPLESGPMDVDADQVGDLVRRLLDPRRRVPVVVLSVDEREPDLPSRHAADLARRVAGTAAVARLRDKPAQDRLNATLGPRFAVYGGALRTYLAEFDPATEDYPQRHPVRSGSALRELGLRALDVVVTGVIGDGVRRPLPLDVRRGLRLVPDVLERGLSWGSAATAKVPSPRNGVPARPSRVEAAARPGGGPAPKRAEGEQAGAPANGRKPCAAPQNRADDAAAPRPHAPDSRTSRAVPAPAATPAGSRDLAVPGTRDGEPPATSAPLAPGTPASGESAPAPAVFAPPPEWAAEVARLVIAQLSGAFPPPRALGGLVRELRAVADKLDRRTRADLQEAETEALAAELARLRDDYDLLVLQYEELSEEARRSEDRIRRLDGLLAELSAGADAVPAYDVWVPECLADVLIRARAELPRVSLPDGLDAGAATLDKAEPGLTRVWAGAAWDALRALNAYATARSANTFRGGFRDWCRNPPHGAYALSPKKFAMKESDAVAGRAKFRKARTFPVPPEVCAEGSVFMEAHVKLRGIGNPAPRMHFHDDSAGVTGKIHVGYLGHHLDNTRTN
jgi:hypothetical protein